MSEEAARVAAEFVGGEFVEGFGESLVVFRVNGRHIAIVSNDWNKSFCTISYGEMKADFPEYPNPIGPCVRSTTVIGCLIDTIAYSRSPAMKEMIR